MQAILLSREEVAQRAEQLYESRIRQEVEVEENIGKIVIIDRANITGNARPR